MGDLGASSSSPCRHVSGHVRFVLHFTIAGLHRGGGGVRVRRPSTLSLPTPTTSFAAGRRTRGGVMWKRRLASVFFRRRRKGKRANRLASFSSPPRRRPCLLLLFPSSSAGEGEGGVRTEWRMSAAAAVRRFRGARTRWRPRTPPQMSIL